MGRINLRAAMKKLEARRYLAMRAIANNTVNFFKIDVFNAQGFIDKGVERWKERKPKTKRSDRKILVDTGRGRQSIHAKKVTSRQIIIEAEADYMRYHNEGTKNLPKRKFMGRSKKLDIENLKILKKYIQL